MSMAMAAIPIGEVAARSGIAASALRYYERLGLIDPPERAAGRRTYQREVFHDLAVIDLFTTAGFSLADVAALRAAGPATAGSPVDVKAMAQARLARVRGQIDDLRLAEQILGHVLACPAPEVTQCSSFRHLIAEHAAAIAEHGRSATIPASAVAAQLAP